MVSWAASVAGRHFPSMPTSTASMPRCWAQATPAIIILPAASEVPCLGVSIRDSVLIGARCDQPRCDQYAVNAPNVVSSMSTTHLQADTYPYNPGTTTRTGKPCTCGRAD